MCVITNTNSVVQFHVELRVFRVKAFVKHCSSVALEGGTCCDSYR